ncbi:MAG: ABC transporter permease [Dehalogenimonas sp.]|uniref:ABC transporter permease n=1 Tax=Candidatus Dehalogenimonas loeffleri TaxID=3127115 RepID=A0ABZ2J3N1_9CHLR|nr:ABC transporter permease [Dehalogenimonas sp.]
MKALRHIWFIALKDLKIFASDRGAVFFFIIFPLLFITFFNFLMAGVGSEDSRLNLRFVTLEKPDGISHQILVSMETTDETTLAPGEPVIIWERDFEAAQQAVDDGDIAGFIYFPADFTARLLAEAPTNLEIYVNAENTNMRAALHGIAGAIASQINTHQTVIQASVTALISSGVLANDPAAIGMVVEEIMAGMAGSATTDTAVIAIETDKVGEVGTENPANWVIPGYLVMFVFFAAALAAEMIVKERTNHTLERLLSTSVRKEAILGGIYTGTVIRGIIQIIIFWTVGILVFKVDLGLSPGGVIMLSLLMVVMSSAFAVMLATLAKTQRSAGSLAVITALVLAPLGGCWWPSFLYPQWLQTVAKITPHAWATSGFNKLMVFGADFGAAVPEMLALVVFTVIFAGVAITRFRISSN